jgi:hypothetical protein
MTTITATVNYETVIAADTIRMKIAGMQVRLALLEAAERQAHRESLLDHTRTCEGCVGCTPEFGFEDEF